MKYWTEYTGHEVILSGKRNKYDSTIYTFDIETTTYLFFNNKNIKAVDYLKLSKKEQELCEKKSTMYIWMVGINENVYYGRKWQELYNFFKKIEELGTDKKKYCFVHNLSFEFQFLRNIFTFKSVFARKSRKVMKCELEEFNFEFRCTYFMSNCSLAKLPEIYQLDLQKLVGNLDYSLIRNTKTKLSKQELEYCQNDCLVVYKYILRELETFKELKKLPMTSTGHVRLDLKNKVEKNYKYLYKVRKSINTDAHVYNLMLGAFAGGYTHASWLKSDIIIDDVISYDICSSYPFCMVSEKYPSSEFKKITWIKKYEQLKIDNFAYLIRVKFYNIKSKYINTFISTSKCTYIKRAKYDNGRIIFAEELEIIVTEIDLKLIFETYNFEKYIFNEVYFATKDYLPKEYIEFILDKYVEKTQYKNVEGKELQYSLSKNLFNSLYGMTVTNNIRSNVIYSDVDGWQEIELSNDEIKEKLLKQKEKDFLSFSTGIYVTAYRSI